MQSFTSMACATSFNFHLVINSTICVPFYSWAGFEHTHIQNTKYLVDHSPAFRHECADMMRLITLW